MTYLEALWKYRIVYVTTTRSASGKYHGKMIPFVCRIGLVLGTAKNGMLRVHFGTGKHREIRCVPPGCLMVADSFKWVY